MRNRKRKSLLTLLLLTLLTMLLTIPVQAAKRTASTVTTNTSYKNNMEFTTVRGLDAKKKTVWKYVTKKHPATELRHTTCIVRKDKVYILENSKIVTLRKKDGKKLWTASKVSPAGHVYGFDKNDNLYVTGYYDNYIYKISARGKILWKANIKSTGNYWPYKITASGNKVTVWYEMNLKDDSFKKKHKVVLNEKNGKVFAQKSGTDKITTNRTNVISNDNTKSQVSADYAYKKLIKKYEAKYGKAKLNTSKSMHYWKGVCFAKLLDFDNDGTKELVLVYQNGSEAISEIKYHVELWTFDGKNAKKICSSVSWSGNNCEYFGGFSIIKFNGNYLLFLSDGAVGNDVYYGRKSNGTLGAVHSFHWKGDYMEGQWYYNGKEISVDEYTSYRNQFNPNSNWYNFASEEFDKTIRNELAKTRKILKM